MFFNVFEKAIAEQFERMNFDCSVDATRSNRIGRYINDSAKMFANSAMKKIVVNGIPRLCLFARKTLNKIVKSDMIMESHLLCYHGVRT